jgi:simple sugar transport system permease protein
VVTDGFPIAAMENNVVMQFFVSDLGHGFKSSLLWWLFLSGYFLFILNYHPLGNLIMATGANEEAAFSMGVKVKRVKMLCFVVTVFLLL